MATQLLVLLLQVWFLVSVAHGNSRRLSIRPFGRTSDGEQIASVESLWRDKRRWYDNTQRYWSNIDATIEGVSGYSKTHVPDVTESKAFILSLGEGVGRHSALDVGAGIGRVSKHVLIPLGFANIVVAEQQEHFLAKAKDELGELAASKQVTIRYVKTHLGKELEQNSLLFGEGSIPYDLVAICWTLMYMTDDDIVSLLRQIVLALSRTNRFATIFVKENVAVDPQYDFYFHSDDHGLMRTAEHYERLFRTAGLRVVKSQMQQEWFDDLFPMRMFALRPQSATNALEEQPEL